MPSSTHTCKQESTFGLCCGQSVNGDCDLLCWLLSRSPLLLRVRQRCTIYLHTLFLVLLLQLPWQYFLVCVGAAEGPLLDHGASGFPSVILKHACQAFTVCHVSHACKADTISFVIVTDFFFKNLLCVCFKCMYAFTMCTMCGAIRS